MNEQKRARLLAFVVYALACAVLLALSIRATYGTLVFPLDDVYIHFAIARTLADHGTYGLQPGAFSTPSSSLLWPLFLAAARIVRVPLEWAALLLAVGGGAASLVVVDRALGELPARRRLVLVVLVGVAVPLVPMAVLGMEHSLHIACILWLVFLAEQRASALLVALAAALASGLRYETAFVVVPLTVWLAARGDGRRALATAVGALAPVLVAGAIFHAQGAPFFPLSVVLKRTHIELGELGALVLQRFVQHPHVPALLVASATCLTRSRPWVVCGATALLGQTVFAQLGWFYRYESYAIALVAVGLAAAVPARASRRLVLALVLAPLWLRAAYAHGALPKAARNVAEQQRAMAAFIASLAPTGAVAVNDVGAVAYFSGARVLDLMGLSDLRVANARQLRIDRPLPVAELERLAAVEDVRLAILYEPWFAEALPASWVPLERWRIRDNRVCAFDTVTIFATSSERVALLRGALSAFRPRLPGRVEALPLETH